jgi:hypothetical protein
MSQSFLKKLENPAHKHPQAYFPSYRAGSQDTILSQTLGKAGWFHTEEGNKSGLDI